MAGFGSSPLYAVPSPVKSALTRARRASKQVAVRPRMLKSTWLAVAGEAIKCTWRADELRWKGGLSLKTGSLELKASRLDRVSPAHGLVATSVRPVLYGQY